MKKIIITMTLILILGTVNANITDSTTKPVQNVDTKITINVDQNINFLPNSKVNKSLQTVASLQSCLAQCSIEAEACWANGGGRQCIFDLVDCRELC